MTETKIESIWDYRMTVLRLLFIIAIKGNYVRKKSYLKRLGKELFDEYD